MRALAEGISWGGLAAGPGAWAVSTQLNYTLVDWQCGHGFPAIPLAALVLVLLAAVGGALSWRAWHHGGASFKPERAIDTERFLAMIGILSAALFSAVILLQGAASLILDECVR